MCFRAKGVLDKRKVKSISFQCSGKIRARLMKENGPGPLLDVSVLNKRLLKNYRLYFE